jgi:hypothetical protein
MNFISQVPALPLPPGETVFLAQHLVHNALLILLLQILVPVYFEVHCYVDLVECFVNIVDI